MHYFARCLGYPPESSCVGAAADSDTTTATSTSRVISGTAPGRFGWPGKVQRSTRHRLSQLSLRYIFPPSCPCSLATPPLPHPVPIPAGLSAPVGVSCGRPAGQPRSAPALRKRGVGTEGGRDPSAEPAAPARGIPRVAPSPPGGPGTSRLLVTAPREPQQSRLGGGRGGRDRSLARLTRANSRFIRVRLGIEA
jgi:hypothetical protein